MDDSGQATWLAIYWAMLAAGVTASIGTWIWIGLRRRRSGPLVPYEPRGRVPWDFGHVLVILLVFESPLLLAMLSGVLGDGSAKNGSRRSGADYATAGLRPNSGLGNHGCANDPDGLVCAGNPHIPIGAHCNGSDAPGNTTATNASFDAGAPLRTQTTWPSDGIPSSLADNTIWEDERTPSPLAGDPPSEHARPPFPLAGGSPWEHERSPSPLAGASPWENKWIPSPLAGEGGERSEPGGGEHKHLVRFLVAAVGSHSSQGGGQAGHDGREGLLGAAASEQREPPVDQWRREERRTSERAIDDSSAPDRADTYHPVFHLLRRDGSAGTWLLCIAVVVLVAPVTEELMFRLVLQGWLAKKERLWRRRLGVLRIVRPGWFSVVVVALWFAAQHARGAEQPLDPHVLRQLLVVTGAFGLLTTLFTLLMLRVGCRASLRDLGLPADRLAGDLRLGAIAFLAVGPPVMALQDVLGRFVLPRNVAPDPIPLFVLAMALGGLYYRTGRIVPSIVLHMMLNGASLLVAWAAIRAGLMASTTMPLR